ncbi:hypothetical protein [Herbidospora mongoliensis]|uniref:hypothetical protein n=1 Tax=Herbidospora mongoliensis TaxID=688067 RepID=UPI00082A6E8A|nr:hypothetical protein [Herbidospora mongoliensis]
MSRVSADAARQAAEMVAEARDDPAARVRLAARSYERPRSLRPYRRAAMAFMRWQIQRGLMDPVTGSPWWRAVNETLLRDTTEASLLVGGASGEPSTPAVGHWTTFLRDPGPRSWYCAHNASIVAGYLDHRDLVELETPLERFFMDVALLRVLYAHCLLSRPGLALGRLAFLGPLLGDPRRRGADLFLSLSDVLPEEYPLDDMTIEQVLDDENSLGRIFDYGVIAPRIDPLYRAAAEDLGEPRVATLHTAECPVYAWPYEYRHVWRTSRSRAGIALVGKLLGPIRADR